LKQKIAARRRTGGPEISSEPQIDTDGDRYPHRVKERYSVTLTINAADSEKSSVTLSVTDPLHLVLHREPEGLGHELHESHESKPKDLNHRWTRMNTDLQKRMEQTKRAQAKRKSPLDELWIYRILNAGIEGLLRYH
jgi:hypothetical protein